MKKASPIFISRLKIIDSRKKLNPMQRQTVLTCCLKSKIFQAEYLYFIAKIVPLEFLKSIS